MTATETPPRRSSRGDALMTKLGILLVVVLAVVALGVSVFSGGSGSTSALGASTPTKVTIPSIKASSSLVPLGQKPDGTLNTPPLSQPMQASWYDKSPTPGEIGPAVVLGHVNGGGKPGVFLDLNKTKAGDQVFVDRQDGQTAVFTIDHIDTVRKDQFPTQQVYGDTTDPQLRLITCGGDLDREAHSYLSNVVVYANLTEVRTT